MGQSLKKLAPGSEEKKLEAYHKHHKGKEGLLTREEFQKILEEVITEIGFTGIGAKDTLFYIFGVPVMTLFLKQ